MAGALRDLKEQVTQRFKGNQYASNLLGESINELIQQATAKTLDQPDEDVNQRVVYAINSEAGTTQSTKEIVGMIKKRFRTDNAQKHYLGVVLIGKVLSECSGVLGPHQDELLQEVARVLTKPTRNHPAAARAKQAAKDVLRTYGRSGAEAFRSAAQQDYYPPRLDPGMGPVSGPVQGPLHQGPGGSEAVTTAAAERASIVDEVKRMIEQSKGHSELLNEMLVNQAGGPADEFERELLKELLINVRELREMFNVYLEQLSAMEGPDSEALMCSALEAVDGLDNALALEKEVKAATQEQAQFDKGKQAAVPIAQPAAAVKAAAAPERNLIDLDDLGDALPPTGGSGVASTSASAATADPFAGLDPNWSLSSGAPSVAAAHSIPAAAAGYTSVSPLTAKSPFVQAGMPGGHQAGYPAASLPQQTLYQQQQQSPYGSPAGGFMGGHMQQPPQQQQQFYPGAMPMPQQQAGYGGYSQQQLPNPFQQQQVQAPTGSPPVNYNNPFGPAAGGPGLSPLSSGAAATGSPMYAADGKSGSVNPFAQPAAVPSSNIDQEWDQLFAQRR